MRAITAVLRIARLATSIAMSIICTGAFAQVVKVEIPARVQACLSSFPIGTAQLAQPGAAKAIFNVLAGSIATDLQASGLKAMGLPFAGVELTNGGAAPGKELYVVRVCANVPTGTKISKPGSRVTVVQVSKVSVAALTCDATAAAACRRQILATIQSVTGLSDDEIAYGWRWEIAEVLPRGDVESIVVASLTDTTRRNLEGDPRSSPENAQVVVAFLGR